MIEEAIQSWGFETVVRASLEDSRESLRRQDFALIFCEDECEDGTYRDLLSMVRDNKIPVVVMTPLAEQGCVLGEAIELGALDVLPSPFSRQDVQWMVISATQRGSVSRIAR